MVNFHLIQKLVLKVSFHFRIECKRRSIEILDARNIRYLQCELLSRKVRPVRSKILLLSK